MYNKVIMIGRLVADPEMRTTPGGDQVARYRIALDRPGGKGKERKTDFFNVYTWGKWAEFVCKYFAKGRLIGLEGQLRTREYTDKNDNKRMAFEIRADRQFFTESKASAEKSGGSAAPVDAALPPAGTNDYAEIGDDDDLPF